MAIMTHAKFHFNWLMLTLIFGIWASESPRAWQTTEKAGPVRVKSTTPIYNEKLRVDKLAFLTPAYNSLAVFVYQF